MRITRLLLLASVAAFAPPNETGSGASGAVVASAGNDVTDAAALAAKRGEFDTLQAKPNRSVAQNARMNELKADLDAADKAAADAKAAADIKAAADAQAAADSQAAADAKAEADRLAAEQAAVDARAATARAAPLATALPRDFTEMRSTGRVADPTAPLVQPASVVLTATGTEVRTGDAAAVPGLPDLIAPAARGGEVKLPDLAITATLDSGFHPNPPTLPDNAGLATSADPDAARKAAERAEERRAARDPALAERREEARKERAERNADVKDKRCILMLSREYAPSSVPDVVLTKLTDLKCVPQDGFAVRSVPADDATGVPAHLRISFDPGPGWIDRDLLAAMLAKPVAEALSV